MGLPPADQQWVDDQVSRMSGGTGVAGGGGSSKPSFGIRLLTGMHYVLSDPTQIVQAAQAANAATSPNITSVAFSGTTPNFSFSGGLELFYQISPNFELNLGGAMTPLSSLQYTSSYSGFLTPSNFPLAGGSAPTYSNPPNYSSQAAFQYTYGASVLTASLGGKLFFGDPKTVKFSVGLGIDLSPVSLSFTKNQVDPTSNDATMNSSNPSYLDYNSSGSYGTMAFGGHLIAGMDFALGNNLSLGLYAGFRLLSASNFQNGSDTLQVNNDTSDVGPASQFTASNVAHTAPLSLDFSGAIEGLDLSIAF
jgi:hypothetical protein